MYLIDESKVKSFDVYRERYEVVDNHIGHLVRITSRILSREKQRPIQHILSIYFP